MGRGLVVISYCGTSRNSKHEGSNFRSASPSGRVYLLTCFISMTNSKASYVSNRKAIGALINEIRHDFL